MKFNHKLHTVLVSLLVIVLCLSVIPVITMAAQDTRTDNSEIGFTGTKQDNPAQEEDGDIRVPIGSLPTTAPTEPSVPAPAHIAGDINDDTQVNNEDVVLLLWHTLFPEDYPLSAEVKADLTGNGKIDNEDVVLLLWHTLFPEDYPLN